MSGIFGAFYRDGEVPSGALTGPTACLAARGADAREVVVLGPVALAVCRYDWELEDDFAGPVMVVDEGDLVVAADASLYYRRGLERALASRGVCPTGKAPSHLVLAAYRAWGDQFAARLDGDFAFVLFDRREQRLLAARDFAGVAAALLRRPRSRGAGRVHDGSDHRLPRLPG